MKLKSFGCSHIWGSDHADVKYSINGWSQTTWPAVLAQKFNLDYLCYAWPGRGNFFVASQVLDQIAANESALFVINWTHIDRFDYFDPNQRREWLTCLPQGNNEATDAYYRHLHSDLRDKLSTMMLIKMTVDALEAGGYPYIMTYMQDLMWDRTWHVTPTIINFQDRLKPRMLTFEGRNFVDWAGRRWPVSSSGHLLESGHAAVAQHVSGLLGENKIQTARIG